MDQHSNTHQKGSRMYQLIQAQTRTKGNFNDWERTEIGEKRIVTIFTLYSNVLVYLYDVTNDKSGWLDLYSLPVSIRDSVATLNGYLNVAVGLSLIEDDPFAVKGDNYVRFLNAMAYKFTFRGTNANFSTDEALLPDQQVDLLIARDGVTDYTTLVSKTLFTVNGLCFRAWPIDGEGITLNTAGKFASKFNDCRVGILDFSTIGNISTYPITEEMIKGGGADLPLANGFFLQSPVALTGKTVGLVVAGKLYLLSKEVSITGETRIQVHMQNINLLNHYFETHNYLDYSAIPLTLNANSTEQVVANEFTTDTIIKAFLTSNYSFLVVIDSINLEKELVQLKRTHIDGQYISPTATLPDLPLQVGNGYLGEYALWERDGFWAIETPHSITNRWFYETVSAAERSLVQNQRYGYAPTQPAEARFLLIKKVV